VKIRNKPNKSEEVKKVQTFDRKAKVNNSRCRSVSCSLVRYNIPPSYTVSEDTLEKVKAVMNEDVSDMVVLFKALSDQIRLRILKALRISDLCVCVLVELMDCEYSRLSYHLKLLKKAGLIDCTKEGNFLIYYLTELGREIMKRMDEL